MNFQEIAAVFGITDPILDVEEIHSGNINRTYLVTVQCADGTQRQYIFQRINTFVFKQPESVMSNILAVTEHIKGKMVEDGGSYERRVLSFLTTTDGKPYYYSSAHHFFRVYEYVADSVAYNRVSTPAQFYEAGHEFGEFQGWLADFPVNTLSEIIPNFHNTPTRYAALRNAAKNDVRNRLIDVKEELNWLLEREEKCSRIVKALESGEIPVRVTHNDTKINNILFDLQTDKAICVIDLDTVMPGSSLYDFGDAIRFGACTTAEDEVDLSKVALDLNLYEQFTKGFVEGTGGLLQESEIALLPYGAFIMTVEVAVRFLTDYLEGDVYFKIRSQSHNLERARCQIRLAQDMEAKWDQMQAIADSFR